MKNSTLKSMLFPALIVAMLFSACKKESDNEVFDALFYQTIDANATDLVLFIDGTEKGKLTYLNKQPTCTDNEISSKVLRLPLKAGSYDISARNASGKILSSTKMKISKAKSSSKGGIAGTEMSLKDNCLVVRFFE